MNTSEITVEYLDHMGTDLTVVNGTPVAHKAPASLGSKVQRFANLR